MIPVNKVVNVTITTAPIFPKRKGFGILLIIGNSAVLPNAERSRSYADIDSIADDFGTSAEEYKAAQAFFQQNPKPTTLRIGRRFTSAVPGELLGKLGALSVIATWNAITAGSFKIIVDGGSPVSITGLNFSTDANLNAVAARIQAALITAGITGAVCIYSGTRFIIRSGTTGTSSSVAPLQAAATGTPIITQLGMDAGSNPISTPGAALEDAATALQAQQDYNTSWYGVSFTNHASTQDLKDAAAWVEARVKIFGYTTSDSASKDPLSTTDIGYFLSQQTYRRTFGIYDSDNPYAVCSAIAREFSVDFQAQNSTITMKFKILPGQSPENITVNQMAALNAKHLNYYTQFGDSAMLAESFMADGTFFDEVHGLDWLQNEIETNVFGFLYTRTTKVPQTDKGVLTLVQQVQKGCEAGVNNGLLAPGIWGGDDLGQIKNGDLLKTGYYVYAQPVAQQDQTDRENRLAPPIQVIARGAGAIHNVNVALTFQR
jgi:Protein of unknown function (DUF3383)